MAERLANIAWFRALERSRFERPKGETVAQLLAPLPPRVAKLLWEPLNLAALNTPAKSASAQVFANVLKASFAIRGDDSDFVLPTTDLSDFFPEQAARYLRERSGVVLNETRAQVASAATASATVIAADRARTFAGVIVAVGPHQLDQAFTKEYLDARPDTARGSMRSATCVMSRSSRPGSDIRRASRCPGRLRGSTTRPANG